jgi:hypothetical protein
VSTGHVGENPQQIKVNADAKPAPAAVKPAVQPAIPEIDPAIEACIRSADDLGHASMLLREQHPELDFGQRIEAIRTVTRKIFASWGNSAQRREIAKLAGQHRGEAHKEGKPERGE